MELGFGYRTIFSLLWIFGWTKFILQVNVIDALSAVPPNVIVILTDDQDVVLNGMVSKINLEFKTIFYTICFLSRQYSP